jgi:copper homeostasis protein CutC
LPVTNKSTFVWATGQDQLFKSGFPNGSFGRVLIAGWQAAEPHFVPLLNRLVPDAARVAIITGGAKVEANRAIESVRQRLGGSVIKASTGVIPCAEGFDHAMRGGVLESILSVS